MTDLIDTSHFKNGMSIELDGDIFTIVEFQHVKPGKGGAFVRTKLKNVKSGATLEKTFRAGEKMEQAILGRKSMNYLYSSDGEHFFMDMESFDQVSLPASVLGDGARYLKENTEVQMLMHKEKIIGGGGPLFLGAQGTQTRPPGRGERAPPGAEAAAAGGGAGGGLPP